MNVCVINPNYYRSSGVTVAIRSIYEGAKSHGIDQYFVNCHYGNVKEDLSWIPPGKYAEFDLMGMNPLRIVHQLIAFSRWLRQRKIKVVHVHHRRLAGLLGVFRSFGGFRTIYTGHLTYAYNRLFRFVQADGTTAITASVKDNMLRTMRAREVTIISNSVVFPAFREANLEAEVDAVCIARFDPVKGHEHLIRAWGLLRDLPRPPRLALVGEGVLRTHLEAVARECGVASQIEFRGFCSDIPKELRRGRFGILVSRVEGQGIAVLEAAAQGLPSLTTEADGLRDCLPPDRTLPNGIEFGNVPALAAALRSWLANPADVAKEGRIFYDFLRNMGSIEEAAKQYADLYHAVGKQ